MPASEPATPPENESRYPAVERFIERADPEELPDVFESVREGLSEVKGAREAAARKAAVAIERTEELLGFLLEVRAKLIAEQKGRK